MAKRKLYSIIFIAFLWGLATPVSAWDSTGHKLVAQIAYDHLNEQARQNLMQILGQTSTIRTEQTLVALATWPDDIKRRNITIFNAWHYVDLPLNTHEPNDDFDAMLAKEEANPNVIGAISQSILMLENKYTDREEKNIFLRFLVHFVGDIHQPLHCVSRITPAHPEGDKGGNLFRIKDSHVNNLHAYWDQGVGYFGKFYTNYPLENQQIKLLAQHIAKEYPQSNFKGQVSNLNPSDWANESYNLANTFVYNTQESEIPSEQYIQAGQVWVEQRIALAGYRLAYILNDIFG